MGKRKASQQKKKATAGPSLLAKLEKLRNFVGSGFSESDLSACLSQCAYNIDMAAEILITGQFQSKSKGSNFFAATPSAASKPSNTNTPASKRHRVTPALASSSKKVPSAVSRNVKPSVSVASTPNNNTAVKQSPLFNNDSRRYLWLCERWIVGLSTTKNGRFRYQESVEVTHSHSGPAMVRFRGDCIEGTLRPNVCALLTPLLRRESPLISLEAHALMEERGVPIGGDVPLCLR